MGQCIFKQNNTFYMQESGEPICFEESDEICGQNQNNLLAKASQKLEKLENELKIVKEDVHASKWKSSNQKFMLHYANRLDKMDTATADRIKWSVATLFHDKDAQLQGTGQKKGKFKGGFLITQMCECTYLC